MIEVTVTCPECGGPIPYEVEEVPSPFRGLLSSWRAQDLERECSCQVFERQDDMSDEDAWAEAWDRLDQEAIRLARATVAA